MQKKPQKLKVTTVNAPKTKEEVEEKIKALNKFLSDKCIT